MVGRRQGPEKSREASQDLMLMSSWRMLANSTWQPLRVPHKSSFKSQFRAFLSLFSYMELVKTLQGQFCLSRKAQLESAQSAAGKAQDRGRLNPPRTSLATFITLVTSQELKDGPALPAAIALLQSAAQTPRSVLRWASGTCIRGRNIRAGSSYLPS